MKVLLIILAVIVWPGATAWALSVTPERGEPEALPDLVHDITWLHRTPVRPASVATLAPTTTTVPATTTTTARHTTPPPTARAAAPRPPSRPNTAGVEQWRPLVALYPWDVDLMLRVMWCESKGDPNAINSIGAAGLFQHYPTPANWRDPAANTALAFTKWSTRGLQPWVSSRRCWG